MAHLKILLALALFVVANANKTDDVVDDLIYNARKEKDAVTRWYRKEPKDRNKFASKAVHYYYHRAKDLKGVDHENLLATIWSYYQEHKKQAGYYRSWGGWNHQYAEDVHTRAMNEFYDAYNKIKQLDSSLASSCLQLELVFSNQGGSKGTITEKVFRGSKQASSITKELSVAISASVGGFFKSLTGSLSSDVSTYFSSTSNFESYSHYEKTVTIDLSKPIYIYQVVGSFKTQGDYSIFIRGTEQIFSEPIKNIKNRHC